MFQKRLDRSAGEKAVAEEAAALLPDQQAGGTEWRARAITASLMRTVALWIAATAAGAKTGDPREKMV